MLDDPELPKVTDDYNFRPMRRVVLPMLLITAILAAPAWGQGIAGNAAPPARAASASESAVSERVRREASNPMRIILEAARIRRTAPEAETTPAARRSAAVTVTVAVAAAAVAPAPPQAVPEIAAARLPALIRTAALTQAASIPAALPAPMPAVAHELREAPVVVPQLLAAPPPAPPPAPLPAPNVAPRPQDLAPAIAAAPRLLTMVNPEIPSNVLRRIGYPTEIAVQLTINRDGSVSNISLLSAALRSAEPYIAEALAQWKFEPVAEPRAHRLQLVFNN